MIVTEAMRPWIRLAQEGDDEAAQIVLSKFKPLVDLYTARYGKVYASYEDAKSVAWQGVITCIREYDFATTKPVVYFMAKSIHRQLNVHGRESAMYHEHVFDVEDECGQMTDLPSWLEDTTTRTEDIALRKVVIQSAKSYLKKLHPMVHEIIFHRCQGKSFREISRKMGMSHSTTKKLYDKGINEIRRQMIGDVQI